MKGRVCVVGGVSTYVVVFTDELDGRVVSAARFDDEEAAFRWYQSEGDRLAAIPAGSLPEVPDLAVVSMVEACLGKRVPSPPPWRRWNGAKPH